MKRTHKKSNKKIGKRPFLKLPNPLPLTYTYTLTYSKKDKYIRFNGDIKYPLYVLERILKYCKKKKIDEKTTAIGLLIQVPNPFSKKSKKSSPTHSPSIKKGKSGEGKKKC